MSNNKEKLKAESEMNKLKAFCKANYLSNYEIIHNASPDPDFSLQTPNGIIGIEESQLMNIDELGLRLIQHRKTCDDTTKLAKEIFDGFNTGLDLRVTLHYTKEMMRNKGVSSIANQIANMVKNEINNIKELGKVRVYNSNQTYHHLVSPKVESLMIADTTGKFPSFWSNVYKGWVPRVNFGLLDRYIKNKEGKIIKYHSEFTEKWLLLTMHRFKFEANFDTEFIDDIKEHEFLTNFDKIILFDCGSNETIYLKCKKY